MGKKELTLSEATECVTLIETKLKSARDNTIKAVHGKSRTERKQRKRKVWWTKELGRLNKSKNFISSRIVSVEKLIVKYKDKHVTVNKLRVIVKFYITLRELLNKKYNKLIKKRKRLANKEVRMKLINGYLLDRDIFWKEITNSKGARVEVDIDINTLKEAYERNFNHITKTAESNDMEEKMKTIVDRYEELVKSKKSKFIVSSKKIKNIIASLKNKKAPGKNGITNELYKYGMETRLPKIVANLFESIIRGGYFPVNLNIGVICTIIKDSAQSNTTMDNTRPITLSEVLSNVLENYILEEMLKNDVLNRHQFGFRKNSSCMHAVFSIKEITEDVKREHGEAYALFLDFSKAFDKVNRTKLLYTLIKGSHPRIWLLIKNYYSNLTLYVSGKDGELSSPFGAGVGVKQGGNMSPWLFNKYINKLIDLLERSKRVYKLKEMYKGIMVYADDTNVISHTVDDLNVCIGIIERYCALYDISINAKKTKWMRLGEARSSIEPIVKINGDTLEKVDSFKFLGVIIESNGSYKKHLEKRRSLFMTGLGEIQRLGINKKDVPTGMKTLLYTSLVRSKLTYGLETLKMGDSVIKKCLGRLESNAIKIACGLNLRSKSTALLYGMGITPIDLYIFKRKISFILQLLKNQATCELIINGIHLSISDTIEKLGVHTNQLVLSADRYRGMLRSICMNKLDQIRTIENSVRNSDLVLAVKYLLSNATSDNLDTLQYLLDPRRTSRG
jgi:hypothetical protein